jgi:hypothetical protein
MVTLLYTLCQAGIFKLNETNGLKEIKKQKAPFGAHARGGDRLRIR